VRYVRTRIITGRKTPDHFTRCFLLLSELQLERDSTGSALALPVIAGTKLVMVLAVQEFKGITLRERRHPACAGL
jgi:hypothetical protein